MLIPVVILFILFSTVFLFRGIRGRKETLLLKLNLFWLVGSFGSAYFTWLAWQDRGYSENWAMIGFIFFAFPYIFITGIMVIAELFFTRKWQSEKVQTIRLIMVILLVFLMLQVVVGVLSA